MKNILLLAPMYGNGGIASWTKKFLSTFPDREFCLIPVSSVKDAKSINASVFRRAWIGLKELLVVRKNVLNVLKNSRIDILHTTTSGSLGSFRDYVIGKLCRKRGVKTIMHCRYGCMSDIIKEGGILRKILFMSLKQYDQVWVLDKYTYNTLESIPFMRGKVFLTPNSIEVKDVVEVVESECKKFAFIANVVPTKGIFELIQAFRLVKDDDASLHIVGPADGDVLSKMNQLIAEDSRITYYGKLPNDEAVKLMKDMDALVLPTYYSGEAFPISILEAMSCGKLVISTPRAAIPDMLTAEDGTLCGLLVSEQSVEELQKAIEYAIQNPKQVEELRRKSFQKVWSAYRAEIVYEIYRDNYRKILNN